MKTLLLVEDDTVLREQLARRLQRAGYQLHACASNAQALAVLDHCPSLTAALLDQNIGNDSGLNLIAPLRRHSPACRIVMLTGYGSIPAAVSATREGACNYLTKPASLTEILRALNDHVTVVDTPLPDSPPSLERLEWEHIQQVLEQHQGNISASARTLGIDRRTLQWRLKKRPSASQFRRDQGDEKSH